MLIKETSRLKYNVRRKKTHYFLTKGEGAADISDQYTIYLTIHINNRLKSAIWRLHETVVKENKK